MSLPVIQNALLQCTCGTLLVPLSVISQTNVRFGGQLAATIGDNAPGANIPSFGICSILSAAAAGVPTPCAPGPASCWTPGSVRNVRAGSQPLLLDTDQLPCAVGGLISVADPGQQETSGE